MDSDAIWGCVDEQRLDLADMLDGLSAEQWSAPSLCAGWTVREVATHITQSHASHLELARAALRWGFRFNTMVFQLALSDTKTPEQITAHLRAMVGSRRRPPGTAELDPLTDMLVHGQDIAVPLGIARPMPIPAAVAVADRLWRMRFPANPQRRLPGVRFVADDAEFTVGDGYRIDAPIRDIVMILGGRPAPITEEVNAHIGAK